MALRQVSECGMCPHILGVGMEAGFVRSDVADGLSLTCVHCAAPGGAPAGPQGRHLEPGMEPQDRPHRSHLHHGRRGDGLGPQEAGHHHEPQRQPGVRLAEGTASLFNAVLQAFVQGSPPNQRIFSAGEGINVRRVCAFLLRARPCLAVCWPPTHVARKSFEGYNRSDGTALLGWSHCFDISLACAALPWLW